MLHRLTSALQCLAMPCVLWFLLHLFCKVAMNIPVSRCRRENSGRKSTHQRDIFHVRNFYIWFTYVRYHYLYTIYICEVRIWLFKLPRNERCRSFWVSLSIDQDAKRRTHLWQRTGGQCGDWCELNIDERSPKGNTNDVSRFPIIPLCWVLHVEFIKAVNSVLQSKRNSLSKLREYQLVDRRSNNWLNWTESACQCCFKNRFIGVQSAVY